MTDDERNDLLELKAFLERVIPTVEDDLIVTDPRLSKEDYDFLVKKASMFRDNLNQIIRLLNESK